MDDIIKLQGISKSYKVARRTAGLRQAVKALVRREYTTVGALKDISFAVRRGETVGYIGPNGAGKSTTIKVMSGILVPDAGTCTVLGHTPWKERSAYVRKIGVVFGQRSQLWWDVPVIDSFELLKEIYRIPLPVYKANLDHLADMLQLGELLRTPVRQLSLGQRMRCEIAASLLHSPDILFLDEPTIGLDAPSKLAVRQFLKTLSGQGVTIILTTHDMNDIEALAERIVMIGKGTLLYDGSLRELRSRFGAQRTIAVEFRRRGEPQSQSQRQSQSQQQSQPRPPSHLQSQSSPLQLSPQPAFLSPSVSSSPPPVPVDIPGAELLSWSPERAVYSFDADRVGVTQVLAALSEQLDVTDAVIESKPVDELIVQLYKEHRV